MNNLIINPQFIGSQQTHRKDYIEWIYEEIIVLKIKERERKRERERERERERAI
jgi:hypothetical protein